MKRAGIGAREIGHRGENRKPLRGGFLEFRIQNLECGRTGCFILNSDFSNSEFFAFDILF
jgi:hypothetical protein